MARLNLLNIPDELKNQFKSVCAAKGMTMREEIIRLMEEMVKKAQKAKK